MERIRVDTDELKAKAKVFETSANVYSKSGDEILGFVAGLPSYDGQLSGPARATALEINRQCKEIHAGYKSDADELVRIAKAFEDIDNTTINSLQSFSSEILNWLQSPSGTYLENILHGFDVGFFGPGGIEGNIAMTEDILLGLRDQFLTDGEHKVAGGPTYGYIYDEKTGLLIINHNGEILVYDMTKIDPSSTLGTALTDFRDDIDKRQDSEFALLGTSIITLGTALTIETGAGALAFIASLGGMGISALALNGTSNNCQTDWNAIASLGGGTIIPPDNNSLLNQFVVPSVP